jgi:SAM-dependent methyltransferase
MFRSVHIPYSVNKTRWFEYEQRWKEAAVWLLNKYVPDSERAKCRVLDFGCGRGEFLKLLADYSYHCEGVDFDLNCVNMSSKFAKTQIADEHTIEQIFDSKSFDVVAAIHVLEHVRSPVEFIHKLNELAQKYILIAVSNLQGTAYLPVRGSIYEANKGHLFGWDHSHFYNFIERVCGLEILEFAHDTVVLKTYFGRIDKILGKQFLRKAVRKLENGWLLESFHIYRTVLLPCVKQHKRNSSFGFSKLEEGN